MSSTGVCDLRDLAQGRPGLTPSKGASLEESAAVCLEFCRHKNPVELQITGLQETTRKLVWREASAQQQDTYADLLEATEDGACAIAISVVESTMGLIVLERSRRNSAFDYWLGDEPGVAFQRKARLEVSGILQGDPGAVDQRIAAKLERLKKYRNAATAFVAVVEFGTPLTKVVAKK